MKKVENVKLGDTIYKVNELFEVATIKVTKLELVGERGVLVNDILAGLDDTEIVDGAKRYHLTYSSLLKEIIPKTEEHISIKTAFIARYQDSLDKKAEQLELYKIQLKNLEPVL